MKFKTIITTNPDLRLIDGKNWLLREDLIWESDEGRHWVREGFLTDLASIPFWIPIPRGEQNLAAIIHDWLYSTQIWSRKEADQVLRDACLFLGVNRVRCWVIYRGVRLGGWVAWRKHKKHRYH